MQPRQLKHTLYQKQEGSGKQHMPTGLWLFLSPFLFSFCVFPLCDLIHPHGIDADEIMISKIYDFNPDLASELQSCISSVGWISPSGWPRNYKLGKPIIEFILSLVH